MRLILGLGNPGPQYEGTRHNVGFDAIDELARRHLVAIDRERHRALYGTGQVAGASVMLAKPLTYMNLSGEAARPLLGYHGMEAEEMIVIHDEADLEPGVVRVKDGGGLAGHKGLKSLNAHLGHADFVRIRIGVGRPPAGIPLDRWVLARPNPGDAADLAYASERAADAAEMVIREGREAAMRAFNRRTPAEDRD